MMKELQEKRKEKMTRKLVTIYEQLSDYSKEEIDAEIAKLTDDNKKIFYLRNGDNLECPTPSIEFTGTMKKKYFNIVNLMRQHLATSSKYLRGTIYWQLNKINPNYSKEDYQKAISMLTDWEKDIIFSRYGEDLEMPIDYKTRKFSYKKVNQVLNHIKRILLKMNKSEERKENIPQVSNELREFYIRAIELLKNPLLINLLLDMPVKDAIILAIIILSYIENRNISIEDIANLLEVDIYVIEEDYRRMLLKFKESINDYIDIVNNEKNKVLW